jgi:hypothetical protein
MSSSSSSTTDASRKTEKKRMLTLKGHAPFVSLWSVATLVSFFYIATTTPHPPYFTFDCFRSANPPPHPPSALSWQSNEAWKKKEMTVLEIKWHSNILSPVSCIFKCQSRPGAVSGNVDSL